MLGFFSIHFTITEVRNIVHYSEDFVSYRGSLKVPLMNYMLIILVYACTSVFSIMAKPQSSFLMPWMFNCILPKYIPNTKNHFEEKQVQLKTTITIKNN